MTEETAEYKTENESPKTMDELTIAQMCSTIAESEILQDAHDCCPSAREIFSWLYQKPIFWLVENYALANIKLQQDEREQLKKEFEELTNEEKRLRLKLDALNVTPG